jgi:hypothetical protein
MGRKKKKLSNASTGKMSSTLQSIIMMNEWMWQVRINA